MKGGRQAKLLAKENQAKKRAEKIYTSFKKDSLKKLKDKILPPEVQTPGAELQTGHNFSEKAEANEKSSFSKTFTKNLKRKGKSFLTFRFEGLLRIFLILSSD